MSKCFILFWNKGQNRNKYPGNVWCSWKWVPPSVWDLEHSIVREAQPDRALHHTSRIRTQLATLTTLTRRESYFYIEIISGTAWSVWRWCAGENDPHEDVAEISKAPAPGQPHQQYQVLNIRAGLEIKTLCFIHRHSNSYIKCFCTSLWSKRCKPH